MPLSRRRRLLLLLALKRRRMRQQERQARSIWVRDIFKNREKFGAYYTLYQELRNDPEKFYNFTRMSMSTFDYLHNLVRPRLERCYVFRRPIDSEERLVLTIRFLASGDSMVSISYLFRISTASVSLIIREVCNVLWDTLLPLVFEDLTPQVWKRTAMEFESRWAFPNCVGAIDGKHIVMQAPPGSGSQFFNFKKHNSIVLLAICNADYKFIAVDIGAYGRQSDSCVFNHSEFGNRIINGTMVLPPPSVPLTGGSALPYVFVGDEAFPLRTNLMRPYPGSGSGVLDTMKRVFNFRLSHARQMIEGTFGIYSDRWRILRRPILGNVETVDAITKATVSLHNLLIMRDRSNYCPLDFVDHFVGGEMIQGLWRQETEQLPGLGRHAARHASRTARQLRDTFAVHFMNEGAVQWQLLDAINRMH